MGGPWRAFRLSVRSLIRSPGFTAPALGILAVGMTALTAIFTVVDAVVFRPLAYADGDRVVILCEDHPTLSQYCVATPGNIADLGRDSRAFSELGMGRGWSFLFSDATGTDGVRGGLADGAFFRAFGVVPAAGRLFSDEEYGPDEDKVALLSHGFWTTRYGGDPSVVGSVIDLDGNAHTVVGVLPEGFDAPLDLAGINVWTPPYFDPLDPEVRGWRGFSAIGKLAAGETGTSATSEARARYAALSEVHAEIDSEWAVRVRPLIDQVLGDSRAVFYYFLAAATLLFLVVCANVANLMLARGFGRRQQLAVRAALGAGRGTLVREILAESLTLAAGAALLALLLSGGATEALLRLAPPEIPRLDEVVVDGRVLGFVVLLTVIATGVSAVLPALRVTAWNLAQVVREGGRDAADSPRSATLRGALLVSEVALSVVLLSSAGVLTRSFAEYLRWDPGFERSSTMVFSMFISPGNYPEGSDLVPVYREVEAAVGAVPGVGAVSTASAGPLFGGGDGTVEVETRAWADSRQLPAASWFDVGPGYFSALGVGMQRGREFSETDAFGGEPVAIVNERLAAVGWPNEDPIGNTIRLPEYDMSLTVVGIAPDVPSLTPGEPVPPELYWSNRQFGRWGTVIVVSATVPPTTLVDPILDAVAAVDPTLSLGTPTTLSSREQRALVRPRFEALVIGIFALAALALAAVGVYAVVSYTVTRRRREMGIRMALGGGAAHVVRTVASSGAMLVAIGLAIGLLGAAAVGPVVSAFAHGIGAFDAWSLGVAASALALAAALAILVPATRATRADPLAAIRTD